MIDLLIRILIPILFLSGVILFLKDYKKTKKEIDDYIKLVEQNQLSAKSQQLIERIAK